MSEGVSGKREAFPFTTLACVESFRCTVLMSLLLVSAFVVWYGWCGMFVVLALLLNKIRTFRVFCLRAVKVVSASLHT